MRDLEKMIELGAIDTAIDSIQIDEWFENVIITYTGGDNIGSVVCSFQNCYEISLKHDRTYSKEKDADGHLDCKYFIQDLSIVEDGEFYIFKVSAWPLDGQITCKKINIRTINNQKD